MTDRDRTSRLAARGALLGFPGVPIWGFAGVLGTVPWAVISYRRREPADWSTAAVGWAAVYYVLAILGMAFGRLLPRVAALRKGREPPVLWNPWLGAYSYPLGAVILASLLIQIHGEPGWLLVLGAISVSVCFAIDLQEFRALRRVARGSGTKRGR